MFDETSIQLEMFPIESIDVIMLISIKVFTNKK